MCVSERTLKRLATFFYLNGREGLGTPHERARHNALQKALNACGGLARTCNDGRMISKAICTLHRLPTEIVSGGTTGRSWKLASLPRWWWWPSTVFCETSYRYSLILLFLFLTVVLYSSLLTAKSSAPVTRLIDWGLAKGLLENEESLECARTSTTSAQATCAKATPSPFTEAAVSHAVADSGTDGLMEGHRRVVTAFAHWPEPQRTHVLAIFVAHGGSKVCLHY